MKLSKQMWYILVQSYQNGISFNWPIITLCWLSLGDSIWKTVTISLRRGTSWCHNIDDAQVTLLGDFTVKSNGFIIMSPSGLSKSNGLRSGFNQWRSPDSHNMMNLRIHISATVVSVVLVIICAMEMIGIYLYVIVIVSSSL